jgi:hypothetical protein
LKVLKDFNWSRTQASLSHQLEEAFFVEIILL